MYAEAVNQLDRIGFEDEPWFVANSGDNLAGLFYEENALLGRIQNGFECHFAAEELF
jgi:hypothetical protein